jgi:hypothetical protein
LLSKTLNCTLFSCARRIRQGQAMAGDEKAQKRVAVARHPFLQTKPV